jgi:hypothetical protein
LSLSCKTFGKTLELFLIIQFDHSLQFFSQNLPFLLTA